MAAVPDTSAEAARSRHAQIAYGLLHELSSVSHPRVSPDGKHVAAVVSTIDVDENTTRGTVWLDGAPLTTGPHDGSPTWSPDGAALAYTSRSDDVDPATTLHVMPIGGPGEVRTICTMPDGMGDVAWSPDGRMLAFTSRTRHERYEAKDARWQSPRRIDRFFSRLNGEDWVFDRPQHVYVAPVDGTAAPRNLTPGEFQHDGVSWLSDSSGIVTSAARHDTWDRDLAVDLYVVELGGAITALTEQTGRYEAPVVSPGGTLIVFRGIDDAALYPQNVRIGVMNRDGSERRWISEALDRTFLCTVGSRPPVWSDERTVLATVEDRGDSPLMRVFVDGRPPESVTPARTTVTDFDAVGGVLASTRTTARRPAELFVSRDGTETELTDVTREHRSWERFAVPCTDGSDEIDAWIMRPDDVDPSHRYPVLLNVHGGPFTQYGEYFFDEAQMQAAAGFVVLMSNPRGGSGRHTDWGQSIVGPKHPVVAGRGWGSVDVDDVLAVLDAALERFEFCDDEHVGMLGGSYGGYMATLLAARAGDRFRAICSERAVNNLLTEEWSSDIGSMFRIEHGPDPVEDPDEYVRMSPAALARDIHVPMLIIHSEQDWRCPINQADELWMTLRLLDRDVTFYRFPGENHELSRSGSPLHRQQRAEIILDYFADKLRDATGH